MFTPRRIMVPTLVVAVTGEIVENVPVASQFPDEEFVSNHAEEDINQSFRDWAEESDGNPNREKEIVEQHEKSNAGESELGRPADSIPRVEIHVNREPELEQKLGQEPHSPRRVGRGGWMDYRAFWGRR